MNILNTLRPLSISSNRVVGQLLRHKATISYPGGEKPTWWQRRSSTPGPTVAVIRMTGPIADSNRPGPGGQRYVNYANVRPQLEKMLQMKKLDALALEINSPGGSPVQSDLIRNEIRRVASMKKIPVLSFVEDCAASGGYYIACAGDDIFVNPSSIVGNIGALIATFGLNRFINRYDIDRRVYKAGENKILMDPFSEVEETQLKKIQKMIDTIHEEFIAVVKDSRGKRLKVDSGTPLFEGDIFCGREAVKVGLADGVTPNMETTLIERFGEKVVIHRMPTKKGLAELFGGGASMSELFSSYNDSDLSTILQRLFIDDALTRARGLPQTKMH